MKKITLAALLAGLALVAVPARADSKLDFIVANKTGYGIAELYVAPSASTDWEENLLSETLEDGEQIKITFSKKAERVSKWDIMIVWEDGGDSVYWRGYKLAEIKKLSLKYDRKSETTTAIQE